MSFMDPSAKELLWHDQRADLARYFPETENNDKLMCCACGRFLGFDDFSIEHIIPRQALRDDPHSVRNSPEATVNVRSWNTLLCNKQLMIDGKKVYGGGCNSWKGRCYDGMIREVLNGRALNAAGRTTTRHLVALACVAYLATVREFGYQIALTQSGLLMRQQFFQPNSFDKRMPLNCQMVLAAPPPSADEENLPLWTRPFNFTIERASCLVACRSVVIRIPLARDPHLPIAVHLPVPPARYKLRPDFRTAFQ